VIQLRLSYRQLSADTLAALKDFYNDKDTRQKHFEDLKSKAADEADDRQWSMEDFSEDWQTSQFWVIIEARCASEDGLNDCTVYRRDSINTCQRVAARF